MSNHIAKNFLVLIIILITFSSACGETAATDSPPSTAASLAASPPDANTPMSGPLVGFYIEDSYEDIYLSIFDTRTGVFRVLPSGPVAVGEGQWVDNGCRLFIRGQLMDLHGIPQWAVPQAVAEGIDSIDIANLSPDRDYIAHLASSDGDPGVVNTAAGIEIISLAPPYSATRLPTRDGAPLALTWSADGEWLYFTNYDENGILQVFRATPDGSTTEQLTHHTDFRGVINDLSPAPNGQHLAYSVQNLFQPAQPYTYQPADEGWVGIVNLDSGASAVVQPAKFGSAEPGRGLVWDAGSENLLIIGDSLPVSEDDPAAGRRVIWATAAGDVTHSIATADGPGGSGGHIGWIAPLGNINKLLVNVLNEFYVYDGGAFQRLEGAQAPPLGMELGRRPVGILPAPIGFPGEAACDS